MNHWDSMEAQLLHNIFLCRQWRGCRGGTEVELESGPPLTIPDSSSLPLPLKDLTILISFPTSLPVLGQGYSLLHDVHKIVFSYLG